MNEAPNETTLTLENEKENFLNLERKKKIFLNFRDKELFLLLAEKMLYG